mmetsp:Transcript_59058/g.104976  ORF Transcript_59058/g.104976 Transcript_59058/m.104976 type:complete len:255 (-) Transcript_59058:563-1327(-)
MFQKSLKYFLISPALISQKICQSSSQTSSAMRTTHKISGSELLLASADLAASITRTCMSLCSLPSKSNFSSILRTAKFAHSALTIKACSSKVWVLSVSQSCRLMYVAVSRASAKGRSTSKSASKIPEPAGAVLEGVKAARDPSGIAINSVRLPVAAGPNVSVSVSSPRQLMVYHSSKPYLKWQCDAFKSARVCLALTPPMTKFLFSTRPGRRITLPATVPHISGSKPCSSQIRTSCGVEIFSQVKGRMSCEPSG